VDVSAAKNSRNKIYFFVTVDGVSTRSNVWSHGADARTFFPNADVPTGTGAIGAADAKIEIVFPHDNLPVDRAKQVNVTATIFNRGTLQAGNDATSPTLRLFRALNAEPGQAVGTGARRTATANGVTY